MPSAGPAEALRWHRASDAQGWLKARPEARRARGRADSEPRSVAAHALRRGSPQKAVPGLTESAAQYR
ncbi:hypothetical protein FRY97_00590 [Phaeodactylibacter luteus]|uniref:Uncharacterized protein n=1 Tax=Phaeodactylibacter luteus TaxID=1564516 RepID=A0A5C6S6W5_9BACT|nr:hypothetical protein FRY97_00590 [Phaeodactylibacter luteus]